ncbi:TPA: hypothetical protein BOS_493 [Bos taurus]|nr:TPA: hypothetical protein BOS_493 [Bos taurus]
MPRRTLDQAPLKKALPPSSLRIFRQQSTVPLYMMSARLRGEIADDVGQVAPPEGQHALLLGDTHDAVHDALVLLVGRDLLARVLHLGGGGGRHRALPGAWAHRQDLEEILTSAVYSAADPRKQVRTVGKRTSTTTRTKDLPPSTAQGHGTPPTASQGPSTRLSPRTCAPQLCRPQGARAEAAPAGLPTRMRPLAPQCGRTDIPAGRPPRMRSLAAVPT